MLSIRDALHRPRTFFEQPRAVLQQHLGAAAGLKIRSPAGCHRSFHNLLNDLFPSEPLDNGSATHVLRLMFPINLRCLESGANFGVMMIPGGTPICFEIAIHGWSIMNTFGISEF